MRSQIEGIDKKKRENASVFKPFNRLINNLTAKAKGGKKKRKSRKLINYRNSRNSRKYRNSRNYRNSRKLKNIV
jgi:hypothetical protein